MVLAIAGMLLFRRDAATVLVATLMVEGVSMLIRLTDLWKRGVIAIPERVQGVLGPAIAYGLPLTLAGSARFFLDYADRFLIERMLGLDAVATYGVPYDIAAKLGETLSTPIQLAAVPILFRLWGAEGRVAASRFASDVFTYTIAIAIPVAALYLIYSESLIVLLASEKYRGAGALTPYILPGVLLGSLNFIVTAGLTVQKRTVVLALTVSGAALINVVLNLVLIPHWQLVGAAIATTTAYAALVVMNYVLGGAAIELRLHSEVVLKAAAATAFAIAVLASLEMTAPGGIADLVYGLLLGSAAAAAVFVALDARLRRLAFVQMPWSRR
jgi:O-antigen/teichoic acid export membrane protein